MVTADATPEVSVLILTYNQQDSVVRAIESVVAQHTGFPFEVIVADDASPDSTADVVSRWIDTHPQAPVRLLRRPQNMGLVDNYFDAALAARGRFIADCAGDDRWEGTSRLQTLYDVITRQFPQAVLVCSQWTEYARDSSGMYSPVDGSSHAGAFTSANPGVISGKKLLEPLLAHEPSPAIHLSTAIYRTEALREILSGADAPFVRNRDFGCEDLPLLLALASRGDIAYVPAVTLRYTVGSRSVSNPADVRKSALYAARAATATAELARRYGVASRRVGRYLRRQIDIIAGAARRGVDAPELSRLARDIARQTGAGMSLRARLSLFLARKK